VNKARLDNLTEERKIIIIAGSNGAGKTTFAREFLPKEAWMPERGYEAKQESSNP